MSLRTTQPGLPPPPPERCHRVSGTVESTAARVVRETREKQRQFRQPFEEQARARFDLLLDRIKPALVAEVTGEDVANLRAMRHGRRSIPSWLVLAVEELACEDQRSTESSPARAGVVATVEGLLQQAIAAIRTVGARIGNVGRRHALGVAALLALACHDPRVEAGQRFARYAVAHPAEAARYAHQRASMPAPRYYCRGDEAALSLSSGDSFIGRAGECWIRCDQPGCRVEIVGDEATDITSQGHDGVWATAAGVEYRASWRQP